MLPALRIMLCPLLETKNVPNLQSHTVGIHRLSGPPSLEFYGIVRKEFKEEEGIRNKIRNNLN